MADQIESHLKGRTRPKIEISDERGELLDTGGGVVKALPRLGDAPFFHMNSDTIWIEGVTPNLDAARRAVRSRRRWTSCCCSPRPRPASATRGAAISRWRRTDGCARRAEREVVPFVYAGAAMLSPALFADAPTGEFSLNRMFDRAIEAGRLYGLRLEGTWMHVGTPAAIKAAEAAILESVRLTFAHERLEQLTIPITAPCRLARASSPFRPRRRSCRR